MKKFYKIVITSVVLSLIFSHSAFAADWNIVHATTLSVSAPELKQNNAASSTQAVNGPSTIVINYVGS